MQDEPHDSHLLLLGLGYCGSAVARLAVSAGLRVTVASRTGPAPDGADWLAFDQAAPALARATHLLATAPPGDAGDPALALHGAAIRAAPALRWLGYLSTTGVYGDRGGGWVDEDTPVAAESPRAARRVAAERGWAAAGAGRAVELFRLAGIYGPGRSPFGAILAGTARRIDKPDHCFGRIHRDDIAAAVLAAIRQDRPPGLRVLNLTDDEPAPTADVLAFAAGLLGVPPPPLVPFDEAFESMSAMARSFWADNRRVRSARTQAALGLRWRYPTYREGLRAIFAEEAGERPA